MKKNKFFQIDKIEQKFVFTLSRGFFWIFVIVSSLTFIASIFVLIYSIIPPSKKEITKAPYPEKPKINFEEVMAELMPKEKTEPEESVEPLEISGEESGYTGEIDTNKNTLMVKFNKLLDSLGSLIKTDWDVTYEQYLVGYDWFGRPIYNTNQKRGIKSNLMRLMDNYYPNLEDRITLLDNLIEIISKIEEDKRLKGIKYIISSLKNKWENYQITFNTIENEYNNALMEAEIEYNDKVSMKKLLSTYSLFSIGGSIIIIALVGLVLNSLAIERNTRAIKELIHSKIEVKNDEN